MRTTTLVKMANQIAVSVPDQAAAIDQTAAHLRMFWTPTMIDTLAEHLDDQPESVSATVREAVRTLRPGGAVT